MRVALQDFCSHPITPPHPPTYHTHHTTHHATRCQGGDGLEDILNYKADAIDAMKDHYGDGLDDILRGVASST